MLLDLSRFRGGVDHIDRRYEPGDLAVGDADWRLAATVQLVADIRKDTQKVRLVGHVRATLECDCSRCLEPFAVPVDSTFDLLFLPVSANAGEDEAEVQDDDLGVSYYKDDVIDLGELMREQFYLTLPMKPLCREECLGLCPVCGVNRNRETCACRSEWVDPRMDALRTLKD